MSTESGAENGETRWPFPHPRVAGVREHYHRVQFFHALAKRCRDLGGKFRLHVAAVYSACGVMQLIYEAADKGELDKTCEELKAQFRTQVPWCDLIERIRIHDFHRFGLVPPDPRFRSITQEGPVNLRAQKGAAIYRLPTTGPDKLTTGNSAIQEQRPLLIKDGQFFDDATRRYVSLEQIVQDFIAPGAEVVKEFEANVGRTNPST